MDRNIARTFFKEALSSLQESTESRVREELRAAVEGKKRELKHKECVDGSAEICDTCLYAYQHNRDLDDIKALL